MEEGGKRLAAELKKKKARGVSLSPPPTRRASYLGGVPEGGILHLLHLIEVAVGVLQILTRGRGGEEEPRGEGVVSVRGQGPGRGGEGSEGGEGGKGGEGGEDGRRRGRRRGRRWLWRRRRLLRAGGARVAKYAPCTSSSSSENSDPSGSTSIAHAAAMPTLLCRERGTFVASAEGETQVKGALCSSRRPQAMRARGWPRPHGASGQRGVERNKPFIREAAPRISLVRC